MIRLLLLVITKTKYLVLTLLIKIVYQNESKVCYKRHVKSMLYKYVQSNRELVSRNNPENVLV